MTHHVCSCEKINIYFVDIFLKKIIIRIIFLKIVFKYILINTTNKSYDIIK